ncbi:MAG: flagellar hook capping protein [Planctomycetaceae bacterium]|nr:flagellar hook capping protein [Planctomycetaceae bacterium]
MAIIDTVLSPTGQQVNIVDDADQGFNALNAESFMKLLITQLQNQDPTEPTSNEELLTQLSQMRNLQSSIELKDSIQQGTSSQSAAASASFIGRTIEYQVGGGGEDVSTVEGVVERAIFRDGQSFVRVGIEDVPIEDIISVRDTVPGS